MSDEAKPTKADLRRLGTEVATALSTVRARHPGLEFAMVVAVPRSGTTDKAATTVVSTATDPQRILVLFAHGAREIQEQMLDPFTSVTPAPKDADDKQN